MVIAVIDSGSGIEKAAQDRVFEPFYTTKPVDKGSGLGLPMVYGFVVQSGGRITLESQPGQGTELRMYLPASATRPAAAAPGPTIAATPTTGCARPRGRLIEDPDSLCAPAPPAGPAVKPRLPAVLSPTAEKGLS